MEANADYRSKLLASIVESSDDAIISFLLNGTVLSWNHGAQKLFGYSVESTMGKSLKQLIGPEMDALVQALKAGEKMSVRDLTFRRGDGHVFYLSARISPLRDEKGDIVSGAAIFRDITQAKQAEKELLVTTEQLAKSNKELEEFAWVAAHDLKEPVRTMATYSRLLLEDYGEQLDSDGKQFLSYINESALNAMERIDDVLKFSAVARQGLEHKYLNLSEIVESVVEDLRQAVNESGARIKIGKLPGVAGEPEYMRILFQNLISNAIKYRGKSSPRIKISATESGASWQIAVEDNGIGFDMLHKDQIFRMFHRLHTGDEYPGTGLGLSMCKKIVELHGGKIWTESVVGKGSTFFFTIPAKQ